MGIDGAGAGDDRWTRSGGSSRPSPRRWRGPAIPSRASGERGYVTLLRAIVGQQVSVAGGQCDLAKLEAATGGVADPANMAATSDEALRAAGLSRQKIAMRRASPRRCSPAGSISTRLPADDEEAIAQLTAVKGIGRWTAEIYLLFAEGRPDIFPAGDLAVQIEIGASSASTAGRPRRRSASSPRPGARTAARRRSSPGTIVMSCRSEEEPGE